MERSIYGAYNVCCTYYGSLINTTHDSMHDLYWIVDWCAMLRICSYVYQLICIPWVLISIAVITTAQYWTIYLPIHAIDTWCILFMLSLDGVCMLHTFWSMIHVIKWCIFYKYARAIDWSCICYMISIYHAHLHGIVHLCMQTIIQINMLLIYTALSWYWSNDWYCYSSYDVYSTSMNMLSIDQAYTTWYRFIMVNCMISIIYPCMLSC